MQFRTTRPRLATAVLTVMTLGAGAIAAAPTASAAPLPLALPAKALVPIEIEAAHVPAVAELDKTRGRVTLSWMLSHAEAHLDVTLTHIATGKEFRKRVPAPSVGSLFSFTWDAVIDETTADGERSVDVPNGKYAVEAEATPLDRAGAPAYQTSFMNIVRTYNPHDYNDNGSTDTFARDALGVLWRQDMKDRPTSGQIRTSAMPSRVGGGWGAYKQIEAVGNLGGAAHGDLVAVDASGVQWLYLGKGDGTFAPRVKIGQGWQVYNKIAGGSDVNGDNRPDLVATDSSGYLWLHKGTGSYSKPFTDRVRIGTGWQVYNHLTAVGNAAGTSAGDLVARDTSGVLWLHQGNGQGGFAPRVKVGGGWGIYSQLVGAGDLDNDGRADMIAYGTSGQYGAYVYRSTGVATAPFSRQTTDLYSYQGTRYTSIA
ncbi:FG-GAP repeat domain-containing protein [Streptomyces zaomyceticus]|uniref:VCBS repeat-containing protein n=1 Tax=Streptomyces zaomyceticus TaxID=68286 RepID=A0ABZ1KZU8_9ACTN